MFKNLKSNEGLWVTLVSAGANFLMSVLKFLGGTLGNSTALVADAIHSMSDLLTDVIAVFSQQIGQIPKDDNHPYGHGRAETIGTTIIGLAIILAGLGIGYDVAQSILSGTQTQPEWIAAVAALVSILINEGLYHYSRKVGEKISSPSIIANAWHHRSDAVSSIAALIGITGAMFGYPIMDPLAGAVVSLMILKVGVQIAREGTRDLMDSSLDEAMIETIQETINETPGVIESHDLRTRRIGGEVSIDVHILVSSDILVSEGHHIAENVRRNVIKAVQNVNDFLVHVDAEEDSHLERIYSTTREELEKLILPVIESMDTKIEYKKMRVHFLKGKNNIELFIKTSECHGLDETRHLFEELKRKIKEVDPVDEVEIFLDLK